MISKHAHSKIDRRATLATSPGRLPDTVSPPLLETDCLHESSTTLHRDYALHDYKPRRNPRGRLHIGTILRYLLRQERLSDGVWPIVDRLWNHLGRDQTVWGAKWTRSGFHSVEFYFYNWETLPFRERRTLSSLRSALEPLLSEVSPVYENHNYEMCSLDIEPSFDVSGRIHTAHIYIPSRRQMPNRDFLSYSVHPGGVRFENHYVTFFTRKELRKVSERLKLSIHAGGDKSHALLLPSQLTDCFRISYAVKRHADGLYFNRVGIDQAIWFAENNLPEHMARMLRANCMLFEHLNLDLGFDFIAPAGSDGPAELSKFAIYGSI